MNAIRTADKTARFFKRLLLTALCICIGITGIIYILRDELARLVLAPYFTSAGITLDSIDNLQLGLSEIRIDALSLLLPGGRQKTQLNELHIRFSFNELLRGHVNQISLGSADVQMDALALNNSSVNNSSASDIVKLADMIALLENLPIDSLQLNNISFTPWLRDAQLSITRTASRLAVLISSAGSTIDLVLNWTALLSAAQADSTDRTVAPAMEINMAAKLLRGESPAARMTLAVRDIEGRLQAEASGELLIAETAALMQEQGLSSDTGNQYEGTLLFSAAAHETIESTQEGLEMTLTLLPGSQLSGQFSNKDNTSNTAISWQTGQPLRLLADYRTASGVVDAKMEQFETALKVITPGGSSNIDISIGELSIYCDEIPACSARHSSAINMDGAAVDGLVLEDLSVISAGNLNFSDGQTRVEFTRGSRLHIARTDYEEIRLEDTNVLVQNSLELTLEPDGTATVSSDGVDFFLPRILLSEQLFGGVVKANTLRLRQTSEQNEVTASLQAIDLETGISGLGIRSPELHAEIALSENQLNTQLSARIANREVLRADASHHFGSSKGEAELEIPELIFGAAENSLAYLFLQLPYEVDLVAGSITGGAQLSWAAETGKIAVGGPVNVEVSGISGFFEETALVNLSTSLKGELIGQNNFVTLPDLSASIDKIDPGLPVENIRFSYSIDAARHLLEIRNLQADLFNGTVRADDLSYDWLAPDALLDLEINHLDLSNLLSMGAYEGIEASGLISGRVPVRLKGSALSVDKGTLHVEAPGGNIRYQSTSNANTGNPALDLVNQALSNYQYNEMEAEVNYRPDGELTLGLKLRGENPDMNQGQAINLNLNISDNIPTLLRSLQSGRSIADAVQRELQNR